MQWYYVKNGQKEGPLSNVDIPQFVRRGEITDETLVWNETLDDWKPYGQVKMMPAPEPVSTVGSAASASCSMCGKEFDPNELIDFEGKKICSRCKPDFIQQIRENAEISGATIMRYAGFWTRFGAIFIDGMITGVITLPANFGVQAMFRNFDSSNVPVIVLLYLVQFIVPAAYYILLHGKNGQTLGKKALGIKVVMSDGTDITYGRATGRYFAEILSGLILNVGYLMAAFDEEKRALHDHICNTRVIYK